MLTVTDRRAALMAQLLRLKGYTVWTSPTASLEADQRARIASQTEAHFLRKQEPEETGPVFSWVTPCPACGEVHPT